MNRRRFLRGCLALLAAPVLPVVAPSRPPPTPPLRLLYGGYTFSAVPLLPRWPAPRNCFPLNSVAYRIPLEALP